MSSDTRVAIRFILDIGLDLVDPLLLVQSKELSKRFVFGELGSESPWHIYIGWCDQPWG